MDSVHLYGASEFTTAKAALANKPVVVGRSGDLTLEGDALEKKHARFAVRGGKILVAPMGRGTVHLDRVAISTETSIMPGDVVVLGRMAAVFLASSPEQEPSKQARAILEAYGRDRVLVRILELPTPGLVRLALDLLAKLPLTHLHTLTPALRPALGQLSRAPNALYRFELTSLLGQLGAETPSAAVFVEAEKAEQRRAAAAASPIPPIDEDADVEASAGAPSRSWHMVPSDSDVGHGYSFGAPPVDAAHWPRSPRDGRPMAHLGTLLVPAEYRVGPPGKIAVAVFQADDHLRPSVADAATHSGEAAILRDGIGGAYALLWLDAATFARGPGAAPAGLPVKPPQFLRLRARIGDPNIGKPIPNWDEPSGDYIPFTSDEGEALALGRYQFQTSKALVHFGGTSVAVDNYASGLGPFYLGIEHGFGGANFGGGNAVLDLARERIAFSS